MKDTTEKEMLSCHSDNLLACLDLKDISIKLFTVYQGGSKLAYFLFKEGKLLFEGKDFRPSNMHGIESIDSLVYLLGFLTVQPGDTKMNTSKTTHQSKYNMLNLTNVKI